MTAEEKTSTRSRNMAAIRGKNTRPEMLVRKYLHGQGFRYRLHSKKLPGKPDLYMARYRLAIFIHGCFWHRHSGCFYCSTPATRQEFWQKKFSDNTRRDRKAVDALLEAGYRVLVIWECGLKHHRDQFQEIPQLITGCATFIEWPPEPPKQR